MTSESRRKITGQILDNKENSETTDDYEDFITEINNKVTSDKVNRDEFIIVNNKITAYKTELEKSAGLFTGDLNLPLTTVVYYQDNTNTIQQTDSLTLWEGASIKIGNVFYVPVVENSEKLFLDSVREIDSDGTTNIEPIIPNSLNSFTQIHQEQYNEKITMDLISWAKAAYTSGYSSYSGTEQVLASNFSGTIEVTNPDNFTIGNYLYFYSGSDFFVGIVDGITVGVDGDPNYIQVSLKTTNSYTGTIYFTEKIVAGSNNAKNILLHLAYYWRSLVISQKSSLEAIPSDDISSDDYDQIAILQTVIDHINDWLILPDIDKYTTNNLNTLTSIFSQRNIDINNRMNYLNTGTFLSDILTDRNEVIKVRLKKRGGTLNSVYREVLALKASIDKKETDAKSFAYYKNKFIVKRVLDGCNDSKTIYLEESSDLAKDDMVYIICDNEQYKEIKTYILDIVNYEKPSNKELALEPNYVTVKKVLLSNRAPNSFTVDLNARIAKQLAE